MWTCTEWTPGNSSDLSPADHVCNCIILAAAAEREKVRCAARAAL